VNSNVEVVPYHENHLTQIELKDVFFDHDLPTRMRALQANPNAHSISLLAKGEVLGMMGLIVYWPGVAEAWSLTSEKVKDHPHAFHKAVLQQLKHGPNGFTFTESRCRSKGIFTRGIAGQAPLAFIPKHSLKDTGPTGPITSYTRGSSNGRSTQRRITRRRNGTPGLRHDECRPEESGSMPLNRTPTSNPFRPSKSFTQERESSVS
jgi:hypothetical protein